MIGRSHLTTYGYSQPLEDITDDTIRSWVGITALMRQNNSTLFPSREYTSQIIRNGEYLQMLGEVQQSLKRWKRDFDLAKCQTPLLSRLLI